MRDGEDEFRVLGRENESDVEGRAYRCARVVSACVCIGKRRGFCLQGGFLVKRQGFCVRIEKFEVYRINGDTWICIRLVRSIGDSHRSAIAKTECTFGLSRAEGRQKSGTKDRESVDSVCILCVFAS